MARISSFVFARPHQKISSVVSSIPNSRLLLGGNYLDYGVLAVDPVVGQHIGILVIEFGVVSTVAAVMLTICYAFAGRQRA